jgi:phosphoribosylanthranilate isomerase
MRVRLKICCIASPAEARLAWGAGADILGLVSAMPSGPGPIEEDEIAEIVLGVPPGVATMLLTSRTDGAGIVAQLRHTRAGIVQLVDEVPVATYKVLRDLAPGVKLVQVIHVTGMASLDEAMEAATHVDALLLDSGNPSLAVKELGGTGRVHDWRVSARIRAASPKPVWLAGGLNVGNVAEAIQQVRPFGVDVCSGVRTDGRLDEGKVGAFVAAVREAELEARRVASAVPLPNA